MQQRRQCLDVQTESKKARACKAGTEYRKHSGNVSKPKKRENPTKNSKRARPEGGTPTDMIRPHKKPRESRGPGTYKGALTMSK
jgi:hypothetical protein